MPRNGWYKTNRSTVHYKDGLWHKEDGPACIRHDNNTVQYWYQDKHYREISSDLEWLVFVRKVKKDLDNDS